MKSWLYIASNPSIPSSVKVGFSRKDPVIRIKAFEGSGLPHPYELDYVLLTPDADLVEKKVHQSLINSGLHDNKEWFKCESAEAIKHVHQVVEEKLRLHEAYFSADRRKIRDEALRHHAKEIRRQISQQEDNLKKITTSISTVTGDVARASAKHVLEENQSIIKIYKHRDRIHLIFKGLIYGLITLLGMIVNFSLMSLIEGSLFALLFYIPHFALLGWGLMKIIGLFSNKENTEFYEKLREVAAKKAKEEYKAVMQSPNKASKYHPELLDLFAKKKQFQEKIVELKHEIRLLDNKPIN